MQSPGRSNDRAIGDLAHSMLERYLGHVEPAKSETSEDASVVLVLGAAASYLSGMPAWKSLYEEGLLDAILNVFRDREAMVDELWTKLSPYIGPQPDPVTGDQLAELTSRTKVEQILGVASELAPARKKILEVLQEHYGAGELAVPQLGYELIAHLLRHGFVDHVVTFNFDEVLDDAIANELGPEGFVRIISDTDLPPQEAAGRPYYLKLHGTISVPESLRFTKEQTQTLTPRMLRLLDKTVFRSSRVHLVTIGYSWNDDDFVQWVVARMERIARLTIVRNTRQVPPLLEERYRSRRAAGPASDLRDKVDLVSMGAVAKRLTIARPHADHLLWALVNGIEDELTRRREPFVSAARHVVLSQAFYPQRAGTDPKKPWEISERYNAHDAKNRLRMEVWLQLIKSKGMLNLSVLARTPRIHRYWRGCREIYEHGHLPFLDKFFLPEEIRPSAQGEVKETYFSELRRGEEVVAAMMRNFTWPRMDVSVPTVILDSPNPKLSRQTIPVEQLVRRELSKIWQGEEVEVVVAPDPRSEWLFHNPKPITSYLALRKHTSRILRQDWTDLLVVAESGSWLMDGALREVCRAGGGDRTVLLIVAGNEGLDGWGAWKTIRSQLKVKVRHPPAGLKVLEMSIPWWRHNRHLSLAVSKPAERLRLLGGIYFRRRLKDSRVAPVMVSDEIDKVELLLVFLAYVVRAAEHRKARSGALGAQETEFVDHALGILSAAKPKHEQRRRSHAIRVRLAALR